MRIASGRRWAGRTRMERLLRPIPAPFAGIIQTGSMGMISAGPQRTGTPAMGKLWTASRPRGKPLECSSRIRSRRVMGGLRGRALERIGRRADHLGAVAADLDHRETALDDAIGTEPEDAVDAGKTTRIGQRGRCEGIAARLVGKDRGERRGVI